MSIGGYVFRNSANPTTLVVCKSDGISADGLEVVQLRCYGDEKGNVSMGSCKAFLECYKGGTRPSKVPRNVVARGNVNCITRKAILSFRSLNFQQVHCSSLRKPSTNTYFDDRIDPITKYLAPFQSSDGSCCKFRSSVSNVITRRFLVSVEDRNERDLEW